MEMNLIVSLDIGGSLYSYGSGFNYDRVNKKD